MSRAGARAVPRLSTAFLGSLPRNSCSRVWSSGCEPRARSVQGLQEGAAPEEKGGPGPCLRRVGPKDKYSPLRFPPPPSLATLALATLLPVPLFPSQSTRKTGSKPKEIKGLRCYPVGFQTAPGTSGRESTHIKPEPILDTRRPFLGRFWAVSVGIRSAYATCAPRFLCFCASCGVVHIRPHTPSGTVVLWMRRPLKTRLRPGSRRFAPGPLRSVSGGAERCVPRLLPPPALASWQWVEQTFQWPASGGLTVVPGLLQPSRKAPNSRRRWCAHRV